MNQDRKRAAFDDIINRHGLCATKDGDLYRSHLVGWMLKAYEAALASPEVQALSKDAERYRHIRSRRVNYFDDDHITLLINEDLDRAIDIALEQRGHL